MRIKSLFLFVVGAAMTTALFPVRAHAWFA